MPVDQILTATSKAVALPPVGLCLRILKTRIRFFALTT